MKICNRDCVNWEMLPLVEKESVGRLEMAMEAIDAADNKMTRCRQLAANAGGEKGWSPSRLRSKYYDWLNAGRSWAILVNWARVGEQRKTPRKLLEDTYKHYCGHNQRSNKRAYERMLNDLRSGKSIKGIGPGGSDGDWRDIWRACYPHLQPPAKCPFGWIPPGMTYRNMQHYAALSQREASLLRIGVKSSGKFTPPVYATREGLKPGMLYQFDDVWHDIEVILPGINKGLARPLEFACIDYASTNKIAYGLSCQIEREDGSKRSLKEREMLWLVCHILTNIGYHKDGCVFVIEHGTATIRPHIRETITRLTRGKVTFRTSDIVGKAIIKGMFDGRGKGNFKAKALVEASHRLLHYEAAYLPAQTGGNSRTDRPEQLDGIETYAGNIIKVWETLPDEQKGMLWMPALTFWAYRPIVANLYRAIYTRSEHKCEGWEANGWMIPEWSLTGIGDWQPVANIKSLPPSLRNMAEAACREPDHVRARRLSPLEVWNNGQSELERLPPWCAVEILGGNYSHRAAVRSDGLIEFMDRNIEPGRKFRYQSQILSPAGEAFILEPGTFVNVYALPHDLSKAVIADDTGAVIGVAPAWNPVSPINATQVQIAIESQRKIIAAVDAPVKARHDTDGDILESLKQSNTYLLQEAEIIGPVDTIRRISTDDKFELTQLFAANFTNTTDAEEGDPNEY